MSDHAEIYNDDGFGVPGKKTKLFIDGQDVSHYNIECFKVGSDGWVMVSTNHDRTVIEGNVTITP